MLIVAAFPVLTAVLALLMLDRYAGTNFFTNSLGGNPMMYVNLIWIWGHPEVYILILPAFGVYSEVVSTYSGKRLFGYTSMVYATVVITVLSVDMANQYDIPGMNAASLATMLSGIPFEGPVGSVRLGLIDASWVNGAPGPNFGEVLVPLPGRETQLGFRLEF